MDLLKSASNIKIDTGMFWIINVEAACRAWWRCAFLGPFRRFVREWLAHAHSHGNKWLVICNRKRNCGTWCWRHRLSQVAFREAEEAHSPPSNRITDPRGAAQHVFGAGLLVEETVVLSVRPAAHAMGDDLGFYGARVQGLRELRGRGSDRVCYRNRAPSEAGSWLPGREIPWSRAAACGESTSGHVIQGLGADEPCGRLVQTAAAAAAATTTTARLGPIRARNREIALWLFQHRSAQASERTRRTERLPQIRRRTPRAEPTEP